MEVAKALRRPYLTYTIALNDSGFTDEDAKTVHLIGDNGLLRTPFDLFRFCIEARNGSQMLGFVDRHESAIALLCFFRLKGEIIGRKFYTAKYTLSATNAQLEYAGRIWDVDHLNDLTARLNKTTRAFEGLDDEAKKAIASNDSEMARKVVGRLKASLDEKMLYTQDLKDRVAILENVMMPMLGEQKVELIGNVTEHFNAIYRCLATICYEYLAQHNFIARVTPEGEGRSIEWKQAREHLTIIHRHHAANCAAVKTGDVVPNDGKNPTRIAHSRRAHTRLLRSAKFRYKQGQRVAVCATWCGPKEWQDSVGQTYEILTPVIP